MKVALCCIGRMENLYIKEYVEYYKNLGIDKIFLYDNNHDGEEHFEDAIGDYINDGFVDITDFRNKTVCQLEAYQDCYDKHGDEYDWICFFDCDEFMVMKEYDNICDFLSQDKFDNFSLIHINWKCYDDNDLVVYDERPVMERFTRVKMPLDFKKGYDFPENYHVKSIVRGGGDVRWGGTPHTPSRPLMCCDANGKDCKGTSPFNPYNYDSAWLNHYLMKTIDEWIRIKSKRGYPDGNKDFFKKHNIIDEFFKMNEMTEEKQEYINRYENKMVILSMTTIPRRLKRLKDNLPSLLNQSYKFDKLVINIDDNLSSEDYEKYNEISNIDDRIEINKAEAKWRSCNKLLPTIIKYPDEIIITVDDDIFYPKDCVKLLVEEYRKHKDCIITHEINPIFINGNYVGYYNAYDVMLKQKEWGKYFSNCCLFPPHCFDNTDLFNYDKMMKCTKGLHDELWFWVNSTINGVQCIGLDYIYSFSNEILEPYKEDEYQLTNFNKVNDNIKGYMDKINEIYGDRLIESIKQKSVTFNINGENGYAFLYCLPMIKDIYGYGCNVSFNGCTKAWENKIRSAINTYFGRNGK